LGYGEPYAVKVACTVREGAGYLVNPPISSWVAQQLREATPYDIAPEYLIHDNDSIFTSAYFQQFLSNINIKSKKTGYRCPWQNGICERVVGILRRELLDHIIPFNEKHLQSLLKE
jgi:putative transposase